MPQRVPLADRMRPKTLDDVAGQQHLLGPGKLLRRMIEADQLSSIILYGPPGTGKTSIAHVIANHTGSAFRSINATTAGKADMKTVVDSAEKLWKESDKGTILFIDEIHRFNKAQQDYLLPYVENGTVVLIGATTENPYFEVNGALLSRSRIFELKPISNDDVIRVLTAAVKDPTNGYGAKPVVLTDDAADYLANIVNGDVRQALNVLELAVETTPPDAKGDIIVNTAVIQECIQKRIMRFDKSGDNHYDFISAFIESMKHSEPDAVLYYLARMLEAGEDPKYIARRILVCAAEDIALADPQAIQVAAAAFDSVEKVGLPECVYALAMAAVYNATAPKSHSVCNGIAAAREDVQKTGNIPIPAFLQDESYKSAHKLGRGGVSDIYQSPYHYDGTDCMPDALKGRTYFVPEPFGFEQNIQKYVEWCRNYKRAITEQGRS